MRGQVKGNGVEDGLFVSTLLRGARSKKLPYRSKRLAGRQMCIVADDRNVRSTRGIDFFSSGRRLASKLVESHDLGHATE